MTAEEHTARCTYPSHVVEADPVSDLMRGRRYARTRAVCVAGHSVYAQIELPPEPERMSRGEERAARGRNRMDEDEPVSASPPSRPLKRPAPSKVRRPGSSSGRGGDNRRPHRGGRRVSVWTDERAQRLANAWNAGTSAREIAEVWAGSFASRYAVTAVIATLRRRYPAIIFRSRRSA